MSIFSIALGLILCLASGVYSQDNLHMNLVAQRFQQLGPVKAGVLRNNVLYECTPNFWAVLDVADDRYVNDIGFSPIAIPVPERMSLSENLAVVSSADTIFIVSVADAWHPQVLTINKVAASIFDVWLDNRVLFVTRQDSLLLTYSVSQDGVLRSLDSLRIDYPRSRIGSYGDFIIVSGESCLVIDRSNIDELFCVRRIETGCDQISVKNDRLALNRDGRVNFYDISNPLEPSHLGEVSFRFGALGLWNENVLVAYEIEELGHWEYPVYEYNLYALVYNVEDIQQPALVSRRLIDHASTGSPGIGFPIDLIAGEDKCIIRANNELVFLGNPDSGNVLQLSRMTGCSVLLNVDGYLWAGSLYGELTANDVSNPASPIQTSLLAPIYTGIFLGKTADRVYSAYSDVSFGRFASFDCSTPASPRCIECWGEHFQVDDIEIRTAVASGNLLLVASERGSAGRLLVLDCSRNPDHPVRVGEVQIPYISDEIALDESRSIAWFGSGNSNVTCVDFSDPTKPVVVATILQEHAVGGLACTRNFLYTGYAQSVGFRIYDVTVPARPMLLMDSLDIYNVTHIEFYKHWAILTAGTPEHRQGHSGIYIWDTWDPIRPTLSGYYETPGSPNDFLIQPPFIYSAEVQNLSIYETEGDLLQVDRNVYTPSVPLLTSYPSPFNSTTTISYSLPRSGWTSVDVMDLNGRLVKRLSEGWVKAGSYRAVLNGEGLPSGGLFIRLNGSGVQQVEKVSLVR